MNRAIYVSLLMIALFTAQFSAAREIVRSANPQYQFPVNDNQSGISEETVKILLYLADLKYGRSIGNTTESWMKNFDWKQPYIAAGSTYDGENFKVMLWGGLVRARYMTLGGVAAVICHEIGHKLGGQPHQKFNGHEADWSSAEGQADTFAATRCLPQMYDDLKSFFPDYLMTERDPATAKICESTTDPDKCRWIASSGIELIQSMQVYFDLEIPMANPTIWAPEKPSDTLHTRYPTYQCRMDIFKSGAVDPSASRLPCWFVEASAFNY